MQQRTAPVPQLTHPWSAVVPHPTPLRQEPVLKHVAVKEAVLPFDKFAGADTLLGPEMRSTGEVRWGWGDWGEGGGG